MSIINFNHHNRTFKHFFYLCLLSSCLAGCASKPVTHLHLDIEPRTQLNAGNDGIPLALMIKIYQLTSQGQKRFDDSSYQQLLKQDSQLFGADLLDQAETLVKPDQPLSLTIPLDPNAQAIAIIGLFRQIDSHPDNWRLVLTRKQLTANSIEAIAINNNRLILQGIQEK